MCKFQPIANLNITRAPGNNRRENGDDGVIQARHLQLYAISIVPHRLPTNY